MRIMPDFIVPDHMHLCGFAEMIGLALAQEHDWKVRGLVFSTWATCFGNWGEDELLVHVNCDPGADTLCHSQDLNHEKMLQGCTHHIINSTMKNGVCCGPQHRLPEALSKDEKPVFRIKRKIQDPFITIHTGRLNTDLK